MKTITGIIITVLLFVFGDNTAKAKETATIEVQIIEKVKVEDVSLGNDRIRTILKQFKEDIEFQKDEIAKERKGGVEVHFVKINITKGNCLAYEIGNALKQKGLRLATAEETASVERVQSKELAKKPTFSIGTILRVVSDGEIKFILFGFNFKEKNVEMSFFQTPGVWENEIIVSAVPKEQPEEKK